MIWIPCVAATSSGKSFRLKVTTVSAPATTAAARTCLSLGSQFISSTRSSKPSTSASVPKASRIMPIRRFACSGVTPTFGMFLRTSSRIGSDHSGWNRPASASQSSVVVSLIGTSAQASRTATGPLTGCESPDRAGCPGRSPGQDHAARPSAGQRWPHDSEPTRTRRCAGGLLRPPP